MEHYSCLGRVSPASSDHEECTLLRVAVPSSPERIVTESNESDSCDKLTPQPTHNHFPSPPLSARSSSTSPRNNTSAYTISDSSAEIDEKIEEYNRDMVRSFDPKAFYPADLLLALPVEDEFGIKLIGRSYSTPDRHLLHKVELYNGYLHIIPTRMGGTNAFHDIAPTVLN